MICRLLEFTMDNRISLKNKACDICEKQNTGKCKFCNDCEVNLTHDKFSWTICRKIKFNDCVVNFKEPYTNMESALKLIHPVFDDIWIILKKNNFILVDCVGTHKLHPTIDCANEYLGKACHYIGRKLTLGDFDNVHN